MVDVENMTEEELKVIQKYYSKLKTKAQKEEELLQQSHSIDEADKMHEMKKEKRKFLNHTNKNKINGKSI